MSSLLGLTLVIVALFLGSGSSDISFASVQIPITPSPTTQPSLNPIKTDSLFKTTTITNEESITKDTVYKDDPNTEAGNDTVLSEGENGKKVTTIDITYVREEDGSYREYDREITDVNVIPPKDKIISRGTKIVWRNMDIPDGQISYWKKMHVYATHYDSHCLGCNEWTATGMRQGKGVIAVDPKVIKLGTKIYVPGYGFAIAGDTGGAIKGNIIDLGYEDAKTAGWWAHFIDIYILN